MPIAADLSTASPLADAQHDMRTGYLGGAVGLLVSGSMWAIAGAVCVARSPHAAVWALFVGGALIHPVAMALTRLFGHPGKHTPGNPLGALALATTVWMILMLFPAYGIAQWRIELFFPAMLFVIGGRYLCFATLYGTRLYYACGAVLALAGYGLARLGAAPAAVAFAGAIIEIAFAGIVAASLRRALLPA